MGTRQIPVGEERLYQGSVHITKFPYLCCIQQGPIWCWLCLTLSPSPHHHAPSSEELVSGHTAGITLASDPQCL